MARIYVIAEHDNCDAAAEALDRRVDFIAHPSCTGDAQRDTGRIAESAGITPDTIGQYWWAVHMQHPQYRDIAAALTAAIGRGPRRMAAHYQIW